MKEGLSLAIRRIKEYKLKNSLNKEELLQNKLIAMKNENTELAIMIEELKKKLTSTTLKFEESLRYISENTITEHRIEKPNNLPLKAQNDNPQESALSEKLESAEVHKRLPHPHISNATVNLLFKRVMLGDSTNKAIASFKAIIASCIKSLGLYCAGVILTNEDLCNLLVFRDEKNTKYLENLDGIGSAFCYFDMRNVIYSSPADHQNRLVQYLRDEIKEIEVKKAHIFKGDYVLIPLNYQWRGASRVCMGMIILQHESSSSRPNAKRIDRLLEQRIPEHVKAAYISDLSPHLNYLMTVCFLDLSLYQQNRYFSTLSKISMLNYNNRLVSVFGGSIKLKEIIQELRVNLSSLLGYQDCGVLLQDLGGRGLLNKR